MDPQQPYTPPASNNPYDFIMNPAPQPKRKLNPFGKDGSGSGGNSSLLMKLAFIVGGAIILMIILAIVASLLGGSKTNVDQLASLAQTQQELIRVANQGRLTSVQQGTRNFASTAELTLRTQQTQTLSFLAQHGRTMKPKELALKQNAKTDQQLTLAKQTSTFDTTYTSIMQTQLQEYSATVKNLFTASADDTEKTMMGAYYEQTQLLISQLPYTQQTQ